MPRSRTLRRALLPVLPWVLVPSAFAGEIPSSAISNATAIPPELLDGPGLVALHPQTSVRQDSQMGALASTQSARTVVGLGCTGRHAAFLVAQPSATTADGTLNVIQGGWAMRLGGVRIGAAFRGARRRDFDTRISSDGRNEFINEELTRLSETSVGVGLGNGEAQLDVSLEITSRDTEGTRFDRRDTVVELQSGVGEGAERYGAWLRGTLPLGAGRSVRVAGGYTDESIEVDQEVIGDSPDESFSGTTDRKGHRWETMIALRERRDEGDWTVWAAYENRRGGLGIDAFSFSTREISFDLDRVAGGVALRRGIWWELDLYAGLNAAYESETREIVERTPDGVGYDNETEEITSETFAWGLSREFDGWRIGGALNTNLSLSSPFASVDAAFLF